MIGITEDILEFGRYVCKALFVLQENSKSDEVKVEVVYDGYGIALHVNVSSIDGK